MIDIGANIGTTSIPRVRLRHFQRAYAAEPARLEYACLVQNVVANKTEGRVLPDQCAIFSKSGTVNLDEKSRSGVHKVTNRKRGQEIPCFTLDDWLERCGADPRRR